MYTLYIDTHGLELVFVLFKDGIVFDERRQTSEKHSRYAISMLEDLLSSNHLTVDDLSLIIVINGPGSFTGVRIGCVIAKIMSYTKNIPLKTLTYLQALDLSFNTEVTLGIRDRNGVFVGSFNQNHELLKDYFYLSNQDYEKYGEEIIVDSEVDLNKVYLYMKEKEPILAHALKPIYVKKLEVENG